MIQESIPCIETVVWTIVKMGTPVCIIRTVDNGPLAFTEIHFDN